MPIPVFHITSKFYMNSVIDTQRHTQNETPESVTGDTAVPSVGLEPMRVKVGMYVQKVFDISLMTEHGKRMKESESV